MSVAGATPSYGSALAMGTVVAAGWVRGSALGWRGGSSDQGLISYE